MWRKQNLRRESDQKGGGTTAILKTRSIGVGSTQDDFFGIFGLINKNKYKVW
jgi:hypothetical protein